MINMFPHPDSATDVLTDVCDGAVVKTLVERFTVDMRTGVLIDGLVDVMFDLEIGVVVAAGSVVPKSCSLVLVDVEIDELLSVVLFDGIIDIVSDAGVDVFADANANFLTAVMIALDFAMTAPSEELMIFRSVVSNF